MLDRVAQRARDDDGAAARIERVDLLAPARECGELVLHRPLFVGDVVDLAAKRINRIHSVPAFPRQEAHRPVKRRLRSLHPLPDRFAQRVSVCLVGDGVERGIAHRRRLLLTPTHEGSREIRFAQLDPVCQRIAAPQPVEQPAREGDDHAAFPAQPGRGDEGRQSAGLLDETGGAIEQSVEHAAQRRARRAARQRFDAGSLRGKLRQRQIDAVQQRGNRRRNPADG